MDTAKLTKIAIALGFCYGIYRFVHNPNVRTAAVGVGAVIVAKNLPFVGDALA